MKEKRKIFIGDVHGCYKELSQLLEKLEYDQLTDKIYFVGDLINRGEYSKEVLDFIIKSKSKSVLGNHEIALLKSIDHKNKKNFKDLIKSFGDQFSTIYLPFLRSLPLYIEEEEFLLVHAGLCPNQKVDEAKSSILTNIRTWDGKGVNLNQEGDPPWYEFYFEKKLVIYGHWAQAGLNIKKNVVGLDSGCIWGKKLSAMILPGRKIVQVDSLQKNIFY